MATPSRKMLVASALGIASFAFAVGFASSSASAGPPADLPIVNINAWDEPAPAMPVELANTPTATCNPWDVSEVAMEEVLLEMQRRGWRPPRQGDATASLASFGIEGIEATNPDAPMPRPGIRYSADQGSSAIAVLSDADAERLRNEEVSVDQILVEQVPVPAPS